VIMVFRRAIQKVLCLSPPAGAQHAAACCAQNVALWGALDAKVRSGRKYSIEGRQRFWSQAWSIFWFYLGCAGREGRARPHLSFRTAAH
jgi:hypothetical protein